MSLKEFYIETMDRIKNGTLSSEEGEKLVNNKIIEMLKESKNGEMLAKVYESMCMGMKQVDIAKQCGVSSSVIFDCVTKLRYKIAYIESAGISLSYFKNFESRPHKYSEKTLEKQEEYRRGIVDKPKELTEDQKRARNLIGFTLSLSEEYENKNLKDEKVIEEINNKIIDFYNSIGKEIVAKIYKLKCKGEKNVDIAEKCGISPSVVENRVDKINTLLKMTRLNVEHFKNFETRPYTVKRKS